MASSITCRWLECLVDENASRPVVFFLGCCNECASWTRNKIANKVANRLTWRPGTYCFHGRPHNDSCFQMISRFSRFCLLRPLSMALLCNLPTTTVTIQSTRTPAHPSSPPKPGVSSEVDRSIWTGAKIQLTDPVPSPFGTVRLARFEASAWARQPHRRFLQLAKNRFPRAGCCPILTP